VAKRVSADTITAITAEPTFNGGQTAESPPPTAETLISRIRKDLDDHVTEARKNAVPGAPLPPGHSPQGPEITLTRALADQQLFEQMLKEVPKGFRLSPVLYSRISKDDKEKVTQEYTYNVRPRFLKFLAEQHAEELKDLGICDHGIERMRYGLDPTNKDGVHYSVNVDHIIERNGSGAWGVQKEQDPDQPSANAKFHPNHFGNFILLPEKIHEFKNELNDLQKASETPLGQSRWILMMIPERNATFTGFVCPKQEPSHRLFGLDLRSYDDFQKTDHGEFVVRTTLQELAELKEMDGVVTFVRGQIAQADAAKTKVADLAADQAESKKPGDLRKAFAVAVKKDPALEDHVEHFVKPAVRDVNAYVNKLFTDLSARVDTPKQRAAFWKFARFFRGQNVKNLQLDVEALPFEEASDLTRSFRQLAKDVTKVCDKLDAEAKARYAKETRESIPDFKQDNNPPPNTRPQGQPLPRRQRQDKTQPRPEEGREKRTFGRPGHFKRRA
jgi:hypothetical protein